VSAEEVDSDEAPRPRVVDVERLERERPVVPRPKMAVSVDPTAEEIQAREDELSAEELEGYLAEIERRNLRGNNRSVLRAKAKMLDAIEAGRAEQASNPQHPAGVSHYDPDDASPFD
jgi:hypothetical protein